MLSLPFLMLSIFAITLIDECSSAVSLYLKTCGGGGREARREGRHQRLCYQQCFRPLYIFIYTIIILVSFITVTVTIIVIVAIASIIIYHRHECHVTLSCQSQVRDNRRLKNTEVQSTCTI